MGGQTNMRMQRAARSLGLSTRTLRRLLEAWPDVIAKKAWGRGYATEVAAAIAAHAFTKLGCERLIALIDPANAASERVAIKLGLRHEKDTLRPGGMLRRVYTLTFPL